MHAPRGAVPHVASRRNAHAGRRTAIGWSLRLTAVLVMAAVVTGLLLEAAALPLAASSPTAPARVGTAASAVSRDLVRAPISAPWSTSTGPSNVQPQGATPSVSFAPTGPSRPARPTEQITQAAITTPPAADLATVWDRIAYCESRNNWADNTGNGYYGGLQEDMNFWRTYSGHHINPTTGKPVLDYARPDLAPEAAQIAAAAKARDGGRGYRPWPVCGHRA